MKRNKEIKIRIVHVPPTAQSKAALFKLGEAIFWNQLKTRNGEK